TDGGTANLSTLGATGGSTAFSTGTLTANYVTNNAPILGSTSGPALAATIEDVSAAVTLTTLLTGASYSDPDVGALKGVALVGADGPGTWQYSVNGGATWFSVGNVSETQALLLNTSAKLRFTPALHQTGLATLVYRAWDLTAGVSGSLFTVTGTGGA